MTDSKFGALIKKYNVQVPRYTSYPTYPFWQDSPTQNSWLDVVRKVFEESNSQSGISLYIHLPFCETLCTYCGCNKRITKNHKVEERYIQAILQEWNTYLDAFGEKPVIKELHLGGGTPTFFKPKNLVFLIENILKESTLASDSEFGFEAHPNFTSRAHLVSLRELGFQRVSFGVQDFDPVVQKAIHRIQPFEMVEKAVGWARELAYKSINLDLIYGLPFQQRSSVTDTIQKVNQLAPDRIAFYSYAHVPWKSPAQRGYSDSDLPDDSFKRSLYELGRALLLESGFQEVGMDHFARPQDDLYQALIKKKLHRNFMGYTPVKTDLLIGLGASSISDAKYGYVQNEKGVEEYQEKVEKEGLALTKGLFLNSQDLAIRNFILSLICQGEAKWTEEVKPSTLDPAYKELDSMKQEGLIVLDDHGIEITTMGKVFIRNICKVFDARLRETKGSQKPQFSKAI